MIFSSFVLFVSFVVADSVSPVELRISANSVRHYTR